MKYTRYKNYTDEAKVVEYMMFERPRNRFHPCFTIVKSKIALCCPDVQVRMYLWVRACVCACVCVLALIHTHVFKSPNENIEKMLLDPIVILIVIEAEKLKTL